MKKLVLTTGETRELNQYGAVEITRNGFDILVEKEKMEDDEYIITIINPYEKVVLKK